MWQLIPWVAVIVLTYLLVDWYRRQATIMYLGRKHILITGCDTGFGQRLVKRLDAMGCHVFAACLTETGQTELRRTCTPRLKTLIMDVTDKETINRGFEFVNLVIPKSEGLWGLVNNAGVSGPIGPVEWMSSSHFRETMDVNTFGLIDITLKFLPLLRRGRGRVVNMASTAGRLSGPVGLPYALSKCAVESFSDGLRQHLKLYHVGVSVHIIEPGFFRTPMVDNMGRTLDSTWKQLPLRVREEFGEHFFKTYSKSLLGTVRNMASSNLDSVIDAYVHALTAASPRLRYTVGWDGMFTIVLSYMPSVLTDWLVGKTSPRVQPAFLRNSFV